MNLTPQQKLQLKRQYEESPSSAILSITQMLSEQMEERFELEKEKIEKRLEAKYFDLEKTIQDLDDRDRDRKSSDIKEATNTLILSEFVKMANDREKREKDDEIEEIVDTLIETPRFIEMTKGDSYTIKESDIKEVANTLIEDPKFIEMTRVEGYVLKESDIEEIASKIETKSTVTEIVKEKAVTDEAIVIAGKLNTLTEEVDKKVIKGLEKWMEFVMSSLKDRRGSKANGSSGGGGMGNVQHENTATSAATTSVTTSYKIAGNGTALWVYYNGQQLFKGTHYTVGSNQKTITFLITLEDSTNISVTYIRS